MRAALPFEVTHDNNVIANFAQSGEGIYASSPITWST
jgi:hypothetical protein